MISWFHFCPWNSHCVLLDKILLGIKGRLGSLPRKGKSSNLSLSGYSMGSPQNLEQPSLKILIAAFCINYNSQDTGLLYCHAWFLWLKWEISFGCFQSPPLHCSSTFPTPQWAPLSVSLPKAHSQRKSELQNLGEEGTLYNFLTEVNWYLQLHWHPGKFLGVIHVWPGHIPQRFLVAFNWDQDPLNWVSLNIYPNLRIFSLEAATSNPPPSSFFLFMAKFSVQVWELPFIPCPYLGAIPKFMK